MDFNGFDHGSPESTQLGGESADHGVQAEIYARVMLPANGVGETLHGSNGFLVSGCVRKEQD